MKLLLVLAVCVAAAAAAAAPGVHKVEPLDLSDLQDSFAQRNILINALVRQLFAYARRIITNGSSLFDIPVLDPLILESYHLVIPAGLINLDLMLRDVDVRGIGSFVVHRSTLNLRDMTFDIDISVPVLDIKAGEYDLVGDLLTAIPLYGKGEARFVIEEFRCAFRLHLDRSDDGSSVVIHSVSNPTFEIPSVKSNLSGVIGGGDIDAIVNAIVDEVLFGYISRFHGAISHGTASIAPLALNPILEQLDTWRYIAPLMPRSSLK